MSSVAIMLVSDTIILPQPKQRLSYSWVQPQFGSAMLSFSLKLKRLKPVLKNLNSQCFSNISGRVMEARSNMELLQAQCLLNLGDDSIHDLEKDAIRTYMELSVAEESFIKQKSIARVNWLALGDNNTKFFHH
ncbi:hypothetical protein RHSIM_RhsimUnG0084700 [Rhododendron simsii]|uniref:Uncharacterized protein n=1 Tax=Rhododendron simsii TaxID=118357 RepID=A0A834FVP4_RHOSS|nr:hypothetical protein RHSIM_RhsimUnG0084700 [Rhododendron simsii]